MRRSGSAFLGALSLAFGAGAGAAEVIPADIARKARDQGSLNLIDARADVSMVSLEKSGARKERRLTATSKRIGGRVHTLLRFRAPSEIAGVALLAIEGPDGGVEEILLYLPKIKRTRRIAAGQRGQAFMESDFAYADLSGSGAVDESAVKRLDDETVGGADCYVLTGKPPGESPYGEVTVWVDKATFVPRKVDYFGPGGEVKKRYTATTIGPRGGRTVAIESAMEDPARGTRTVVTVHSLEAGAPPDEAFTERGLERG